MDFISTIDNTSTDVESHLDDYYPYLSDEVIEACINRSPAMSGADLYEILLKNSPLSIPLADELDNLGSILTSTQIAALQNKQNGLSLRDESENEIRWYEQQTEIALNELLVSFSMDTNAVNPLDSMIAYLTDWGSLETHEMLVPLYWEKQDFTNAQNSIDALAQTETHDELAELLQKNK